MSTAGPSGIPAFANLSEEEFGQVAELVATHLFSLALDDVGPISYELAELFFDEVDKRLTDKNKAFKLSLEALG